MHPDWQEFLVSQQATLDDNRVSFFSDPAAEARAAMEGDVLADCSDLGILRFSGDDARDFLHNQLSNDVNALKDNESRLAAYCNPKGRTLAVVRVFIQDNAIYMLLPREILAAVAKRLQMFVLMSKVSIEDVSDDFALMGIAGEHIAASLSAGPGALPEQPGAIVQYDDTRIIKLPWHESRYVLIGTPASLVPLWQQLQARATTIGHPAWQLLDIHSGQPQVYAETVEAFVPQMLNMHAIDGINFKKGCYPGQEIVARMYYLGKLKRRMYLAHVEQDVCPAPGEDLYAADSGQGAGQVVMASPAAGGGVDLLMVCPVKLIDNDTIRLGSPSGTTVQIQPLPYEVPLEREAG